MDVVIPQLDAKRFFVPNFTFIFFAGVLDQERIKLRATCTTSQPTCTTSQPTAPKLPALVPSTNPLSPPQPLPHVVGVKPSPSLPFAGVVGNGAIRTVAVVELMCSAAVAFLAVCGADHLGDSDRP